MHELLSLHDHGVFLRREALRFGYHDRDLRQWLSFGLVERIRHGAYVAAERWAGLSEVERHVLHAHAVMLTHGGEVALSHVSGAALHGMSLWGSDLSRVHVTRIGAGASRKHKDVAYHDGSSGGGIETVGGSPVLEPARCALGTAALSTVESGIVVLDSAYRLGLCDPDSLRAMFDGMRGWPGTARLQVTLRLASPGAESVGESRARYLFWAHGIPKPELQFPVYDGGELVGISDFAWPKYGVLGEFDGRVKYGRYLRAGESAGDAVFREKVREDRLREATGWRMIRLIWNDLYAQAATANRVQEFLMLGRRRR